MWHDSVCNTVQEPTVTSTIVAKKTTTWGESGFPSEFLAAVTASESSYPCIMHLDAEVLWDRYAYGMMHSLLGVYDLFTLLCCKNCNIDSRRGLCSSSLIRICTS